ncbi:MAG: hypothetical protein RL375_645 [Pseudomonadota bacterium]
MRSQATRRLAAAIALEAGLASRGRIGHHTAHAAHAGRQAALGGHRKMRHAQQQHMAARQPCGQATTPAADAWACHGKERFEVSVGPASDARGWPSRWTVDRFNRSAGMVWKVTGAPGRPDSKGRQAGANEVVVRGEPSGDGPVRAPQCRSTRRGARLLAHNVQVTTGGLDAVGRRHIGQATHCRRRCGRRRHVGGQIAQRARRMTVRGVCTRLSDIGIGGHGRDAQFVHIGPGPSQMPGHGGCDEGHAHGKNQHRQQEARCFDQ